MSLRHGFERSSPRGSEAAYAVAFFWPTGKNFLFMDEDADTSWTFAELTRSWATMRCPLPDPHFPDTINDTLPCRLCVSANAFSA